MDLFPRYQCPMSDILDPSQFYPCIFKGTYLEEKWRDVFISIPNICDGEGWLILPYEYRSKIKDRSIVMVNVQLKLYIFFGGGSISVYLIIYILHIEMSKIMVIEFIMSFLILCKVFLFLIFFKLLNMKIYKFIFMFYDL
jgi:hypothetical protein